MQNGLLNTVAQFGTNLTATLKSVVKLVVESRKAGFPIGIDNRRPLIVLGNGPSLRGNLRDDINFLKQSPTLAVNFFANAAEFKTVRPDYYVLADPHFFTGSKSDPNVMKLIENLRTTDWPMTLFVPAKFIKSATVNELNSGKLTVCSFNFVAVEGFRWFENLMWRSRRGMPRPRNVLIPSLMIGLWLGYHEIFILGADHTWTKTLAVDDDNTVVSVQPHFYADNSNEKERVSSVYAGIRLHEVLESMVIAFRSYHDIERFARKNGTGIYNATPGSMIDAFERRPLPVN